MYDYNVTKKMTGEKDKKGESTNLGNSREVYNRDAEDFKNAAPVLWSWNTIGEPQIKKHIEEYLKTADASTVTVNLEGGTVRDVELVIKQGIKPENISVFQISDDQVDQIKNSFPSVAVIRGDISQDHAREDSQDIVVRSMVTDFLNPDQLENADKNTYNSLKLNGIFINYTIHPARIDAKADAWKGTEKEIIFDNDGGFVTPGPWGSDFKNWHRTAGDLTESLINSGFKKENIFVSEHMIPKEATKHDPEHPERNPVQFGDVYNRLVVVAKKA